MYILTNNKNGENMDSRLVVEIDDGLKKEAQMEAIKNDTTLKDIVSKALRSFLEKEENPVEIKID